MKKQPELTEATRKLIVDSFWELLKELPVNRITVAMVVEKAHVHRSTFYRYYHDVYEILEEIEHETEETFIEQFEWILSHVSNTEFSNVISHLDNALSEQREHILYLRLRSVDGRFIKTIKEEMKKRLIPLFEKRFEPRQMDYLFEQFFSVILTNQIFLFEHPDEESIEIVGEFAEQLLTRGVLSFLFPES